jgi:Ribosomal protein S7
MRGKQAIKRKISPDPKYQSIPVAKFINHIMKGGKKNIASKIVYQSFDFIKEKTKETLWKFFKKQ